MQNTDPDHPARSGGAVFLTLLSSLLMLTIGVATAIVIVQLLFFSLDGALLEWRHLVLFLLLFGAVTYGMTTRDPRIDKRHHGISRLVNGFVIVASIAFFVIAINGLLSLLDYNMIATDLYLPHNGVERFAIQTMEVFCYFLLFGAIYSVFIDFVLPDRKPVE